VENEVGSPTSYQYAQPQNAANPQTAEPVISTKSWFGMMILQWIPFVGTVIYLVMRLIWAFDAQTPPTKKNWARASLLISVIAGVVILIAMFFVFKTVMADPQYQSIIQQYEGTV